LTVADLLLSFAPHMKYIKSYIIIIQHIYLLLYNALRLSRAFIYYYIVHDTFILTFFSFSIFIALFLAIFTYIGLWEGSISINIHIYKQALSWNVATGCWPPRPLVLLRLHPSGPVHVHVQLPDQQFSMTLKKTY